MLRKILVLVALLACTAAHAEAPEVELLLGARGGDVHLIWVPKNWPAGLQGYNLKRSIGHQVTWMASKTLRPTAEFMQKVRAPGASFAEIGAPLLRNFAHAYNQNFGMIDRFPSGIGLVEYALFPVINGVEQPAPVATVRWDGRDNVDLDVGVLPDRTGWDGTEAYFGVDIAKFRSNVTRYYVAEVVGKNTRYVNSGRFVHLAPFEWTSICHRPSGPLPEAITLIAETRFGFQQHIAIKLADVTTGTLNRVCDSELHGPTAAPAPAPVPAPVGADALLSSATLWLDASRGVETDGGRVTTWRDQSASHNDATMLDPARRPHLVAANAQSPALSFRGGQSLALSRLLVHEEMTVFIVGHRTGADDLYSPILGVEGGDKRNDVSWIGGLGVAVVGPKFAEPDTRTPFGETRRTHVLTMRADGEKVWLWRNGRHVHTGTARRSKSKRATGFAFNSVGSVYSDRFLNGELYAILVIPRVLGDAEIQAVHAEMARRYPVAL